MQSGEPLPMFTDKKSRWYNHIVERPYAYHFTTAITRENLVKLNGFDEQFAQGQDMDDVELIYRIKALGLELKFVEDPWVIHQYHGKGFNNPLNPAATQDNAAFHNENIKNLSIRANNKEDIK
jgi:GT2 family glycosyltransferase